MQPSKDIAAIDRIIDARERELAAAKSIRGFIVEFPHLIEALRDAVGGTEPTNGAAAAHRTKSKQGRPRKVVHVVSGQPLTNFQRVKRHFILNSNTWCSAPDLANALGIERGTIGHMLWKAHKGAFEQLAISPKNKVWRLTPEVLNGELTSPTTTERR